MIEAITDQYEIRVLEGAQMGSRQALKTSHAHSIGNSFNSDVYLYDDQEIERQLEILPGRKSLTTKLISGEAILDSKPMVIGQQYKLAVNTPIRIGESLIVVSVIEKLLAPEMELTSTTEEQLIAKATSSVDVRHDNETDDANTKKYSSALVQSFLGRSLFGRFDRPAFLVLFIGCGVLGTAVAAWNTAPLESQKQVETQTLPMQGFSESVSALDNSVIGVNANDTTDESLTTQEVKESILSVFRTYGLKVEVESSSPGKAIVRASTHDIDNLARAKSAALADVYGLLTLEMHNSPPTVETVIPKSKPIPVKPGEKITSVVVGNPSYVVTADKSYFFVGARLSTGHKITSIMKDKILLTKNGETTELSL